MGRGPCMFIVNLDNRASNQVNLPKQIRKCCNLHCVLHRGMVDDTKQIRKYSNLDCVFHCGVVSNDEFSGVLCSCLCMVDDTKLT